MIFRKAVILYNVVIRIFEAISLKKFYNKTLCKYNLGSGKDSKNHRRWQKTVLSFLWRGAGFKYSDFKNHDHSIRVNERILESLKYSTRSQPLQKSQVLIGFVGGIPFFLDSPGE